MGEVNPVIVALDVESAAQAREMVALLGNSAGFYKVGMELYAAAGMEFVRELLGAGKEVFLDLKFYDIGETVKRAVAQVAAVDGIGFLTVHGHPSVMRAAREGKADAALQLLAVTVLTSWTEADLAIDGHPGTVGELVARRVANARDCGMDGLICSPLEVARVREIAGAAAILVTPGVRSAGAAVGDQKRVATPEEALGAGANYLVMGRQITRAADPQAEMGRVLGDLTRASSRLQT